MRSLSHFVLRHKLLTVLFWIAVLAGGVYASGALGDKYKEEFGYPGEEGYEANVAVLETYHNGGHVDPMVSVITLPEGVSPTDTAVQQRLAAAYTTLNEQGVRTVSYAETSDEALLTSDERTQFGLVYTPPGGGENEHSFRESVQQALTRAAPEGSSVRITGLKELGSAENEASSEEESGSEMLETLIAAGAALIVLIFVFGSFLAITPLIVALFAIMGTNLAVLGVTQVTNVSEIIQYIVSLIGLGIAIDYSLLLVSRWREERSHGRDPITATHNAMATAGHAVVFSGLAVAAGLMVLVMLPVEFLRSLGFGSVLIPLMSVAVALTLLPVILATLGRFLEWPRLRKEKTASKLWTKFGNGVVKRPVIALMAALAVLLPLSAAALTMQLGEAPSDAVSKPGPAREALSTLEEGGVPTGVLTPYEVLITADSSQSVESVASTMRDVDGVYAVITPESASWQQGGTRLLAVLGEEESMTTEGRALTDRVEDAAASLDGVRVAGNGPLLNTDVEVTYGNFPLMLVVVGLITLILLIRAFRSVVLAVQALVVNLLSIGAAYGVLVLVWQEGYGSEAVWGIPALGSVTTWVPLMTFAFLFGLSMDYQVFLLSRVREQYDATGSSRDAIVTGLGRIGRLVTSAALILFFAFAMLSQIPEVDVKVMATGMGAAILLDATVVRMLLVPALTALTGRYTWWCPVWLARVLRIEPSPVGKAEVPAPREREPETVGVS